LQGEQIVERRNALADGFGADPFGEQLAGQTTHAGGQRRQRRDIPGGQNGGDQLRRAGTGLRVEISLRHHVEIAAVGLGQHQMAHATPHHDDARLMRCGISRQGDQTTGHDHRDRRVELAAFEGNTAQHVA